MNIIFNEKEICDVNVQFIFLEEVILGNSEMGSFFSGKEGELYGVSTEDKGNQIFCGLGKKENFTLEILKNCAGIVNNYCKKTNFTTFKLILPEVAPIIKEEILESVISGILLSNYEFTKYKTEVMNVPLPHYYISVINIESANFIYNELLELTKGIFHARDLINEPGNIIFPESLANSVQEIFKETDVRVDVLEEAELEKLNMNGLLFVGNGSSKKSLCIVLRWLPQVNNTNEELLGLVGKGVTYDTGGYSLKPSNSMKGIKNDMSGAANVIGCMYALARNNVQKNVVAVIPVCENMISGKSGKVGDIYTAMNGKTVEVLNTDAEGRLILADALHYAIFEEKVDQVINIATLTGGANAAFGNVYSPIFTNDEGIFAKFMTAATVAKEKFWRMPLDDEYNEVLKSDIADYRNVGNGVSCIAAAMFLREFVGTTPWIHIDIAGTASLSKARKSTESLGGTGVAIRTLYELIKS